MTFCFKILKLSMFINFAFLYNVKQTKTNLQKYFTPPPKTTIYVRTCYDESQKRSEKRYRF